MSDADLRCSEAMPTGAGDDDACGETAVALRADPVYGLYHVCEEHRMPDANLTERSDR